MLHNPPYVMVITMKSSFRAIGGVSEPDADSTYGHEGCLFFGFPFSLGSRILGFGNGDVFGDDSSGGDELTSALS